MIISKLTHSDVERDWDDVVIYDIEVEEVKETL